MEDEEPRGGQEGGGTLAGALSESSLQPDSEAKANGVASPPAGGLTKAGSVSVALTPELGKVAVAMTCNAEA